MQKGTLSRGSLLAGKVLISLGQGTGQRAWHKDRHGTMGNQVREEATAAAHPHGGRAQDSKPPHLCAQRTPRAGGQKSGGAADWQKPSALAGAPRLRAVPALSRHRLSIGNLAG
jgi:hypothetical protein